MTTDPVICPSCEQGHLSPSLFADDFRHNGESVHVQGLECFVCDRCGADPVFPDQIRRNQRRIADGKRQADGLLTSTEIRAIRLNLGLTQQEAAVLFGGGANAFSKYERGDVMQSVAMDRLLKAAAFLPGLVEFLGIESGAVVAPGSLPGFFGYRSGDQIKLSASAQRTVGARSAFTIVQGEGWSEAA